MSPFSLGVFIGFGGALLFFILSFFARNNGGHQSPLDPLGPESYAERELSKHQARYNQDPKRTQRALALKFLIFGIFSVILEIILG